MRKLKTINSKGIKLSHEIVWIVSKVVQRFLVDVGIEPIEGGQEEKGPHAKSTYLEDAFPTKPGFAEPFDFFFPLAASR